MLQLVFKAICNPDSKRLPVFQDNNQLRIKAKSTFKLSVLPTVNNQKLSGINLSCLLYVNGSLFRQVERSRNQLKLLNYAPY